MKNGKLPATLCNATASLLRAQELVRLPENLEKLRQAELLVGLVMLSECHGKMPSNPSQGHHGG